MQEPKYYFKDGKVFNRASGELIPEDEPIMVFRARDVHALPMLTYYLTMVQDVEHKIAVTRRISDFADFAANNLDRMKEPDTQINFDFAD